MVSGLTGEDAVHLESMEGDCASFLSAMVYYRTVLLDQAPLGDRFESHTVNFKGSSSVWVIPCSRGKPSGFN